MDQNGAKVNDKETLARIKSLVIPPAWQDVWICPHPFGHIQAVGTDAAGRKQYLYHPQWRQRRDREKFEHMLEFAAVLPQIRRGVSSKLAARGLGHDRVLATAVRLLDRGFFRIGSEGYAEQNQTYGLATIKKSHVKLAPGNRVIFDYIAKSGKRRVQSVVDPEVYRIVSQLKSRKGGGHGLLAYKSAGKWQQIHSSEINEFLKELSGLNVTAKDFRTWSATVLAAVALAVSGEVRKSPTGRKRAIARAVQEVAHYLGNTPAVCRSSYIDPRVFDRYNAGVTIARSLGSLGDVDVLGEPSFQGDIESAVLELLSERTARQVRPAA